MIKGLKDFLFRPEVIAIAIGLIFAAALGDLIASAVADLIMPIVGSIFGEPDFGALKIGPILIGNFINALINFIIIGTVLYFLSQAADRAYPPAPEGPSQEDLLGEIRDLLKVRN